MTNLYEYNSEQLTLKEIAKREGLNYSTLRNRLHRGATVSEALSARHKAARMHLWEGKEWTLRELAQYYEMPYITLSQRMARGMHLDKALNLPVSKNKRQIQRYTKRWKSILKHAKSISTEQLNIERKFMRAMFARVRNCTTPEQSNSIKKAYHNERKQYYSLMVKEEQDKLSGIQKQAKTLAEW